MADQLLVVPARARGQADEERGSSQQQGREHARENWQPLRRTPAPPVADGHHCLQEVDELDSVRAVGKVKVHALRGGNEGNGRRACQAGEALVGGLSSAQTNTPAHQQTRVQNSSRLGTHRSQRHGLLNVRIRRSSPICQAGRNSRWVKRLVPPPNEAARLRCAVGPQQPSAPPRASP